MSSDQFTDTLAECLAVLQRCTSDGALIYACMDWLHRKAAAIAAEAALDGIYVVRTNLPKKSRGSAEGRTIAKEAYIYGFSVVDNLRVQHAYFVDRQNRCASGSTLALGEPIAFAVHFENVDMMS